MTKKTTSEIAREKNLAKEERDRQESEDKSREWQKREADVEKRREKLNKNKSDAARNHNKKVSEVQKLKKQTEHNSKGIIQEHADDERSLVEEATVQHKRNEYFSSKIDYSSGLKSPRSGADSNLESSNVMPRSVEEDLTDQESLGDKNYLPEDVIISDSTSIVGDEQQNSVSQTDVEDNEYEDNFEPEEEITSEELNRQIVAEEQEEYEDDFDAEEEVKNTLETRDTDIPIQVKKVADQNSARPSMASLSDFQRLGKNL